MDSDPPPDPIAHVGAALWEATTLWLRLFHARMAARGWPAFGEARGQVLVHVGRGGIAQGALAARTGLTKQAVQQHVDALERDGILERVPDAGDTRRRIVRFAAGGLRALAAADEEKRALEAEFARRAGAEDMAALSRALAAIVAAEGRSEQGE